MLLSFGHLQCDKYYAQDNSSEKDRYDPSLHVIYHQ